MEDQVFNANCIKSIKLFDVTEANIPLVTFEEEIKFLGIVIQKKGFKYNFLRKTDYEIEEKYYFVKNNKIYEKPHLLIEFSDGSKQKYHYDSFDRCLNNFTRLKSSIPVIFNFN